MLVKRIRKLYDIDPHSWEHPADKAALSALKQLKGIDEVIKMLVSKTTERSLRLMVLGSSVKVSGNQYARISNIIDNVVDTFDWPYRPDAFVTQSPFMNAGVLGVDRPFIIINSSIVKDFDDLEMTAIVAHEMGHIMSGHSLYKTLLWMLANVAMTALPGIGIALNILMIAVAEWNRKSELTADRAELLAVQDGTPSYNILMRMAGATDLGHVNLNEFFLQAQEFENQNTMLDSIHKILNQMWLSHPYPVVRLQELKSWEISGQYGAILNGNYLKRGLREETASEDINNGYAYYKETFKNSNDPILKFAGTMGESIEKATEDIAERFKGFFGTNRN